MPASDRCLYSCGKESTGDLDRGGLLRDLQTKAVETPDLEEKVKFIPGTVRGKKAIHIC